MLVPPPTFVLTVGIPGGQVVAPEPPEVLPAVGTAVPAAPAIATDDVPPAFDTLDGVESLPQFAATLDSNSPKNA